MGELYENRNGNYNVISTKRQIYTHTIADGFSVDYRYIEPNWYDLRRKMGIILS